MPAVGLPAWRVARGTAPGGSGLRNRESGGPPKGTAALSVRKLSLGCCPPACAEHEAESVPDGRRAEARSRSPATQRRRRPAEADCTVAASHPVRPGPRTDSGPPAPKSRGRPGDRSRPSRGGLPDTFDRGRRSGRPTRDHPKEAAGARREGLAGHRRARDVLFRGFRRRGWPPVPGASSWSRAPRGEPRFACSPRQAPVRVRPGQARSAPRCACPAPPARRRCASLQLMCSSGSRDRK